MQSTLPKSTLIYFCIGLACMFAFSAVDAAKAARVDLNQAPIEQLMALPHVGRKRAEAILRRRNIRPFRRVQDLLRIRGIGRKLYFRLKPHVCVGSRCAPPRQ